MAKGRINIGDEVGTIATVRRRVTEDRISVSILTEFPHSIIDKTSTVKKGQSIELTGDVTHIDGDLGTVNLGLPSDGEHGHPQARDIIRATQAEGTDISYPPAKGVGLPDA
ncbi:hypothetical protein [Mesorhizobium sp.]|uniref:hypothetical protein n=1 Tax=Mesorhizobium sp. TaxID=1871066 RepID=UPI003450CB63